MTFVLTSGVPEVGFDATVTANHYTTPTNAVAAASLSTTCLYLAVVFVVEDGLFGGVFARDIGLMGLVWAVLTNSLRRPARTP